MKDVKHGDRKRLFRRDGDFLEIAADVAAVAVEYGKLAYERMSGKPSDFTRDDVQADLTDRRRGYIGEFMFEAELNRLKIPHNHDNLVFKFDEDRVLVGDFDLQSFGTVEIKTMPHYARYLVIKKATWDVNIKNNKIPSYVVALKINKEENRAQLSGWLYGSEIAELPHDSYICPLAPCHCVQLDKLKPYATFEMKLYAFRDSMKHAG